MHTAQWHRTKIVVANASVSAFNAVAVPVVFGDKGADVSSDLISFVGIFMHIGLSIAAWRAIEVLKIYDDTLARLERIDPIDSGTDVRFRLFSAALAEGSVGWKWYYGYLFPFGFGVALWVWPFRVYLFPPI